MGAINWKWLIIGLVLGIVVYPRLTAAVSVSS